MERIDLGDLIKHEEWMRALARALVLDDATADDVVQDAWAAALRSPPRNEDSSRGWLGAVVRNLSRRTYRDQERRRRREERSARREFDRSRSRVVEEFTERHETQRRVIQAIVSLDEPLREVVLLRFYEDLPSSEIGRRMNVPAGTVRSRLQRAIEVLRSRLDAEFGDRRAWGIALLPLASPGPTLVSASAVAPSATSNTATWMGIGLLMSAPKFLAAVAIAIVVGLFYFSLGEPGTPAPRPEVATSDQANPTLNDLEPETDPSSPTPGASERRPSASPIEVEPEPDAANRRLLGRVLDQDGDAIHGIEVSLVGSDQAVRTDEAGEFLLPVGATAVPGVVALRAQSPEPEPGDRSSQVCGWATAKSDVLVESLPRDVSKPIDVGAMVLRPAGAVRGRLLLEGPRTLDITELSIRVRKTGGVTKVAKADADGRFFVNGLPSGVVWVTPFAPLDRSGPTQRVIVVAGEISEVDLTFTSKDPAEQIHGFVVNEEGKLDSGYIYAISEGKEVGSARIVGGEFAVDVPRAAEITLEFRSIEFTPYSQFTGFGAGDRDVVLELPSPLTLQVECRFPDGTQVKNPKFTWIGEDDTNWVRVVGKDAGVQTLLIPREESYLRVESDFGGPEDFGPVSRATAGEFWPLTLKRKVTTSLTVVDGVEPVEGVRVGLYTLRAESNGYRKNDLPVRTQLELDAESTDATGLVRLTFPADLTASHGLVAVVEKEGYARTMHNVTLDGTSNVIALSRGGTLRGALLRPRETDPAASNDEWLVAVANGDGKIHVRPVDENGEFEFLNLAAGGWKIREYSPRLVEGSSGSEYDRTEPEDWDFEIREGQTTRFDFNLPGFEMDVEVSIDSRPPGR